MAEDRFNDISSEFDDLFEEKVETEEVVTDTTTVEVPDEIELDPQTTETENVAETENVTEPETELDVIHQYLKDMGIEDSKAIQFQNDEGEIESVDFDTLDRETQLTMLKELADPGLSDHEIEVVNYLRRNNASFDDVIDYFAEQRLQQYLNENPDKVHQKQYSIDEYSDDELYLADLKTKYPTLSEEELLSELDSAKLNEDLFKKKSKMIRQQYKEQEEKTIQEQEQAEQQRYEDLQNNIVNAVMNFSEISIDSDPTSED